MTSLGASQSAARNVHDNAALAGSKPEGGQALSPRMVRIARQEMASTVVRKIKKNAPAVVLRSNGRVVPKEVEDITKLHVPGRSLKRQSSSEDGLWSITIPVQDGPDAKPTVQQIAQTGDSHPEDPSDSEPERLWDFFIPVPKVYDIALLSKTALFLVLGLELNFYSMSDRSLQRVEELCDDNEEPMVPLCADADQHCLYVTAANRLFSGIFIFSHKGRFIRRRILPYLRHKPCCFGISVLATGSTIVANPKDRSIDEYSASLRRKKTLIDTRSRGRPYKLAQHPSWPDRLVVSFPEQHSVGVFDISRRHDPSCPVLPLTAMVNITNSPQFLPSDVHVRHDGRILVADKHSGGIVCCDEALRQTGSWRSGLANTVAMTGLEQDYTLTLEGYRDYARVVCWQLASR